MNIFTRVSTLTVGSALALGVLAGPAAASATLAPASVAAAGAPAAAPATALTLAQAQALAKSEISGRVSELRALALAAGQAPNLSAATRAALAAELSANTTALNALRMQMASETTVAAVQADIATMDNYHIYLLDSPQVRLSIAYADEGVVINRLEGSYSNLTGDLAKKKAPTPAEQATLADLQTQITTAQNALSGQESALLALQPAASATLVSEIAQFTASDHNAQAALTQGSADVTTLRSEV